jgi:hypothetical protein
MRALEVHLAGAGYPGRATFPFPPSLNLCGTEPCTFPRTRLVSGAPASTPPAPSLAAASP